MITTILAAAAATAFCGPVDETIALEAAGQPAAERGTPAWANAPESTAGPGKLGAPGQLLDRTQGAGRGGPPAFLTGDGPDGAPGLKDSPRAQNAEAKYRPRVRALGASAERPSVAEIRSEVARRLKEDAEKHPREASPASQPASDIAD